MHTIARPTVRHSRRLPLAALTALAALAHARDVRASGFMTAEFGSDHGQPELANPYAVYFNPAAMAGMRGTEIAVDGVLAVRSLEYDRSTTALSPSDQARRGDPTYVKANTGPATLLNVLAAPFVGVVTDFGSSGLRLGLASYVPFGGAVRWDKNDAFGGAGSPAPGAYDGPQRWNTISGSSSSIYQTAALAYRIDSARLGFGASVSLIRTAVSDVRAHNPDGSDDIVGQNGAMVEGRSELEASGLQLGAAAGVYWEATSDGALRLGVSYTSQPGFGQMRLKGTFRDQPGTQSGTVPEVPAELLQSLPDVIRAGAAWRVAPEAELRLDLSYERWSRFDNQCVVVPGAQCDVNDAGAGSTNVLSNVPRKWHDAARVRAGGSYWVSPESEVFASVAYSSSPSGPHHLDALTFDSSRIAGTLGWRHAFTKSLALTLAYTYVAYMPVDDQSSLLPNYAGQSRWPSANGHYSSELYLFDAGLSYKFR